MTTVTQQGLAPVLMESFSNKHLSTRLSPPKLSGMRSEFVTALVIVFLTGINFYQEKPSVT